MNQALFVFFYIFLYITLVGGLNWGLVGVFNFNLVEFISNRNKQVERCLYVVVGFSAILVFILSIIVLSSDKEAYEKGDNNQDLIEEYESHTGAILKM